MKLKNDEIEKIAGLISEALQDSGAAVRGDETEIRADIIHVITKNMQDEDEIDAAAEKLMVQFKGQISSGKIDGQQMFVMIKKQLAKDRKFVW